MPALMLNGRCKWLIVVLMSLFLANAALFFTNHHKRILGSYFAVGTVIFRTGEQVEVKSRIKFSNHGMLEFQKSGVWSRSAYREITRRMGSDFSSRTLSAESVPMEKLSPALKLDDDLSFNQEYYLKRGGEFTYRSIYVGAEGVCFYVEELSRVRCFGIGG